MAFIRLLYHTSMHFDYIFVVDADAAFGVEYMSIGKELYGQHKHTRITPILTPIWSIFKLSAGPISKSPFDMLSIRSFASTVCHPIRFASKYAIVSIKLRPQIFSIEIVRFIKI